LTDLEARHRRRGADEDLTFGLSDDRGFVERIEIFDGFDAVCSLTILYRRKRNVGGIVCGWFERSDCRNELWRTRFLIRTMLPGWSAMIVWCVNMFSSI